MTADTKNNILFVNLDAVTNVFVTDNQLTACLARACEVKVGDIVIALRGRHAVAAGRVSLLSFVQTIGCGRGLKTWVRMNLFPASRPAVLSQNQRDVLEAIAKHFGCEYPGFQDVLTIPSDYADMFRSIIYRLKIDICKSGDIATELRHAQLLHLLARTDIADARKIYLCDALFDRGTLADFIYEEDEPRSETDHELDWVATRIVPWDCCTDVERADANNYILLDKHLAENFSMGLVSFLDSGEQLQDDAMDEDAFNPWMDRGFDLPPLNEEQRTYLAWHRAHVFKKWRSGLPPKRMYVQGKK